MSLKLLNNIANMVHDHLAKKAQEAEDMKNQAPSPEGSPEEEAGESAKAEAAEQPHDSLPKEGKAKHGKAAALPKPSGAKK